MKHIAFAVLSFSLFSCTEKVTEVEATAIHEQLFHGISLPVQLERESTYLLLSDYTFRAKEIDSITAPIEIIRLGDSIRLKGSLKENMGLVRIWTHGQAFGIPLKAYNKKLIPMSFPNSEPSPNSVQVKGEFNQWNVNLGNLELKEEEWRAEFEVLPGKYQYQFVVDGKETLDPRNHLKMPNGLGGFNSLLEVKSESIPFKTRTSMNKEGELLIEAPKGTKFIVLHNNTDAGTALSQLSETNWKLNLPLAAEGRSQLRIWPYSEKGSAADLFFPLQNGELVSSAEQLNRTDWRSTVLYFMMVDRFVNSDSSNDIPTPDASILPKAQFYGGDIQGIQQKMEEGYFENLGIGSIWLSPITQNPMGAYGKYPNPATTFSAYHGYWPISTRNVEKRFGTKQELDNLVDRAHEQNLNVILDYVANHVHEEHPVFQQHPDWKTELHLPDGSLNTERWDDHRLTTWFDVFLPTLDLGREEVCQAMTDSALYWIENSDIDGFRHDATKHIPEIFWRTLTQKTRKNLAKDRQHFYQVGETYGSRELISSYVSPGMLDAQFDFNVYDDAVACLAQNDVDFSRLLSSLEESLKYYGHHSLMAYITGNQDRARFISYASGELRFDEDAKYAGWTREIGNSTPESYERLAMLHAFNLSIPGIPVVYYGDEYGSPGGNDPDNRRMFKEEGLDSCQLNLRNRVTQMIQNRRKSLALIYGSTELERLDKDLMLIRRTYLNEEEWVAFNKSTVSKKIDLKSSKKLKTLFGSEVLEEDGKRSLILDPMKVEFLKFEP